MTCIEDQGVVQRNLSDFPETSYVYGVTSQQGPKLFDLTRYETKTKETTKLAGVTKKGFPFLEASLNQYAMKIIISAGNVCLEKRGYSSWEIFLDTYTRRRKLHRLLPG